MSVTTEPSDPLLQFFRYEHLPEHLRAVSASFGVLALQVTKNLPRNAERTVCLRKLLEAKDAAVRTVLYEDQNTQQWALERERQAGPDSRD